jgi:hypothetical protein
VLGNDERYCRNPRCGRIFFISTQLTKVYCSPECRHSHDTRKRDGHAILYGSEHRQTRKKLLPLAYGQLCDFCGLPMYEDQALDLNHTIPVSQGGKVNFVANPRSDEPTGWIIQELREGQSIQNKKDRRVWPRTTRVVPAFRHSDDWSHQGWSNQPGGDSICPDDGYIIKADPNE